MAVSSDGGLSQGALIAASFAERLACEYAHRGGIPRDLFTAFVGLIAMRDEQMCADCLNALEGALSISAANLSAG